VTQDVTVFVILKKGAILKITGSSLPLGIVFPNFVAYLDARDRTYALVSAWK
jgi:hypothetical protein